MLRLLDRYIIRECLGPFVLGLMVFTFMLLMNLLFRLAEMIIQRDVPTPLVAELMAMSLPNILVLTIPMALLFAVLIAIGRLSSDSELIAMRASGISLFALYRPVMLFSTVAAVLTGWLMLDSMPRANSRVESIYGEVFTRSVNKQVQPGIFYDGLADKMLFVFDVGDDGWNGVFLTDAIPGQEHVVQVAERGYVAVEDDNTLRLDLAGSESHRVDLADPQTYFLSGEASTSAILEDRLLERQANRLENRSYKSMTVGELRQWQAQPERTERQRRLAEVEIHQKFSIPAACLVFGLFAVPLGYNNRRGGRSSGFALSIPIILGYHILQSNGEGAAIDGSVEPWLAMWLPNLVFLAAGLFLLARRNRDKSLLFSRLDRWVRQRLWGSVRKRNRLQRRRRHRRQEIKAERRRARKSRAALQRAAGDGDTGSFDTGSFDTGAFETGAFETGAFDTGSWNVADQGTRGEADLVLRLPRFRLAFPTLIDRYLLMTFLRVFAIVVFSGIAVYMLADLTDLFDEIMENDISSSLVLDYYQFHLFQIFKDLSPVVVLLTVLIGFGILSRTSEIIAAKAAGLSLYRLAAPALFAAAVVAGANFLLERSVLPYSNARAAEIKETIKGSPERLRTYRRADRQWLYGQGGLIYHFQNFNSRDNRLQRLHVFRFDERTHELTGRLYAQEAVYEEAGGQWRVAGAWVRDFADGRVTQSRILEDGRRIDLPEDPAFFDMEIRSPEYMPPVELSQYVAGLRESGQDTHQLQVQLYNKTAMPAISLIMSFVALPFAFRMGKKGALYGVGLAIALGIVFYAVVAIFTTLGQAGSLPPLVAVWSPHVLFASMSMYLFLGVET